MVVVSSFPVILKINNNNKHYVSLWILFSFNIQIIEKIKHTKKHLILNFHRKASNDCIFEVSDKLFFVSWCHYLGFIP